MSTSRVSVLGSMRHLMAATLYVMLIAAFVLTTWRALATIGEHRATVSAAENMLARLEGRSATANKDASASFDSAPPGSPFIEGETVNVAGAALLQRIAGAVSRTGGNVLSSQVELQGADTKDGWIRLVVSCEMEQSSLQQLLYDLEAGTPFLFIDQLVVQAPAIGVERSPVRVLLTVSGQWLGGT